MEDQKVIRTGTFYPIDSPEAQELLVRNKLATASQRKEQIRLMLIESDVHTRNQIVANVYLEKDITVLCSADSGKIGLKYVSEMYPNVILVAKNLPDVDGVEVAKEIREQYPYMEVIMLTEHISLEILQQAQRIRVKEVLVKPFTKAEVVSAIRQVARG